MPDTFHPGQRWISESEPELGLGSILRVSDRTVTAVFRASEQKREYARHSAPLRRVRFRAGDRIRSNSGALLTIHSVTERDGLLYYRCGREELSEADLSDNISFDTPEDRLLAGQIDSTKVFDLRFAALQHQHRRRKSPARGFVGGRIDLIPHQLYIASEVSGRLVPRVLLADEVGLGKTIEACLILHRLILTGRTQRALIIVPESLVHQWFVELLRRFNLWFHIFDEERCRAIEEVNPGENPFLDDQLVLCSMTLFSGNELRVRQALESGWDILVVDEAHHLSWSPERSSPEYAIVEALARRTPGLLLLTATPEQLGIAGHFARLRLLDHDRFYDLGEFIEETGHYREIAHQAEHLKGEALESLLDRHGTGRVTFRNTRATIKGFPARIVRMRPVQDPLDWLVEFLLDMNGAKVLLICRTPARVLSIEAALRQRLKNVKVAVFHEGLSLVQRDRNAAWFSDEHGAGILLCSEIGSEGRNFQFAHHLVLLDLPPDPELLEQRIGRLDRIGQKSDIEIHVPYVAGTSEEVAARWYHEGLNAFERNIHGGREMLERFGERVRGASVSGIDRLVEETRAANRELSDRLQKGRDRLLELNSFRPDTAAQLVDEIRRQDQDQSLDDFMLAVFDHHALNVEELAPRTYKLGSAGVFTDSFPGLPADGFTVTCDRRRALAREDVQFLTWDHPLVSGSLDLLLGSEKGNGSFALWPDTKPEGLYLEAIYVLESIAPPHLHVDRFLAPTPLRVLVNQEGQEVRIPAVHFRDGDVHTLLERQAFRENLLPALIDASKTVANARVKTMVAAARKEMHAQLAHEIERLRDLKKVNRSVRQEEIDSLVAQRRALDEHLLHSRIRLDAIRVIQRGAAPAR